MVMVNVYGMKMMTVPIDQAGRVVLPKYVREELAMKPGDRLTVSVQGSSVTLTPNRRKAGFIRRGKALVFSTGGDDVLTQEAVNAVLEEGREERDRQALAGLPGQKNDK
jgi:AbrB family looped-hinge helix DNA binding protein